MRVTSRKAASSWAAPFSAVNAAPVGARIRQPGVLAQTARSISSRSDRRCCAPLVTATQVPREPGPDLLERALEVSGEHTKKAAVTRALQEFIARREQARILDLFGTVEIDPEYDYKAERSRG